MGRADLLCALFVLIAFQCYVKACQQGWLDIFTVRSEIDKSYAIFPTIANASLIVISKYIYTCTVYIEWHVIGGYFMLWLPCCLACTLCAVLCKEPGITVLVSGLSSF